MGQIGPWQIVLILAVVVLVFGAKRLPDTARALGKSLRILKSETAALRTDGNDAQKGTGGDTAHSSAEPQPQPAPRTIQAAPGDVSSARPVDEPRNTSQG
ncbi:Sec-independent protein translocase subunit TatA [Streptomyces sp. NPDC059853]|uniref:Sec-independent protein translocase subunit TatA n=1 Tax=Streptomyces sp. NPDC059853 TaxID=3346973 RepID=UPI003663B7CE